jgi:tetratricopeptide (TPR) repeat protein
MDTKILPVVPEKKEPESPSPLEQWRTEALPVFRKARASRKYLDLIYVVHMMHQGRSLIKKLHDEPLFMEMVELLKTVARSMVDGGFKVNEAFLLFYFTGDQLSDCGDYETAHYCLDKAIAINANDDDVYFSKAWAYGEAGDAAKAIEYFEKTVDVNPAHYSAWALLGYHYRRMNKFARAKKCYENYLAFSNPENEREKERRETARKWLPCLARKTELFGEEME